MMKCAIVICSWKNNIRICSKKIKGWKMLVILTKERISKILIQNATSFDTFYKLFVRQYEWNVTYNDASQYKLYVTFIILANFALIILILDAYSSSWLIWWRSIDLRCFTLNTCLSAKVRLVRGRGPNYLTEYFNASWAD